MLQGLVYVVYRLMAGTVLPEVLGKACIIFGKQVKLSAGPAEDVADLKAFTALLAGPAGVQTGNIAMITAVQRVE